VPEYHAYCIDTNNRSVSRHHFEAADDLAALDKAREFCGVHEVETWQGTRLVVRLAKDGTASLQPDSGPRTELRDA
jgi:hypothetical protein